MQERLIRRVLIPAICPQAAAVESPHGARPELQSKIGVGGRPGLQAKRGEAGMGEAGRREGGDEEGKKGRPLLVRPHSLPHSLTHSNNNNICQRATPSLHQRLLLSFIFVPAEVRVSEWMSE